MRKTKADIIIRQEKHFRSNNIPKLTNKNYSTAFHATNMLAKTKGVSILISKNPPLETSDSLIDKEGRYILIKGSVWGRPITVTNI